ncbi:MAG: hypothetical protein ACK5W9_11940 [Bdellovibrionales bacterium]
MKTLVLLFFSSSILNAQVTSDFGQTVVSLRSQNALMFNSVSDLKTQCLVIDQVVESKKLQLQQLLQVTQTLASQVDPQSSQAKSLALVSQNYKNATQILDWAKVDCQNGLSRAALLSEVYHTQNDTELMVLQYGVGPDLKKIN